MGISLNFNLIQKGKRENVTSRETGFSPSNP